MISITICSIYTKQFPKCVKSIVNTAISDDYEFIVKVDSEEEKQHRISILNDLNAKHTVILNDTTGYENLHIMVNQMAAAAKGDLLWGMGDDYYVTGDWYGAFRKVQKQNPDNIFIINTEVNEKWACCPVVSRGWYETLGYIGYCATNDAFLRWAGVVSGRYLDLPKGSDLKLFHEQGATQKVSKSIRKHARMLGRSNQKAAGRKIKQAVRDFYEERNKK